jgi:DNA-binding LacI/PurR family transcriptional regulator
MTKTKLSVEQSATELKAAIASENRRVTSYDVAQLAGVSQSAVSRCFKPGASVSKDKHAAVMQAAALLDYIPNAAARSLITRRSNMVALIITNQANLYYPELLAEVSQQFNARGKRVLLFTLQREAEVDRVLADVWQYQVDGVIAAARLSPEHIAEFDRRRMPLVLFNRMLRDHAVNTVTCDHLEPAACWCRGWRRPAIASSASSPAMKSLSVAYERRRGACERIAELGLPRRWWCRASTTTAAARWA